MSARRPRSAAPRPTTEPPARGGAGEPASARDRLLSAALRLFSEQGYAKTSIRAIATAAQANVAAVSYYFGDKASLYSAVFTEPIWDRGSLSSAFTEPGVPLHEALRRYFHAALAPLSHGELARQSVRLHIREMLEPTGQWERGLDKDVRQPHEALVRLLCQRMGTATADLAIHRLALTLSSLAFQLWGHRDDIEVLKPELLASAEAVELWADRMVDYAMAMIAAEEIWRRSAVPARRPTPRTPRAPLPAAAAGAPSIPRSTARRKTPKP
ncbi:CerR family C-terminal domain-containing protein [Acidovorax sp. NCPPB 4044]|uniref:CerR family C-terminal domain-containing protein n=1 Tax=Acidovorax sp. NCPPB 4044 TaxID=2940490 RepID=UPI002303B4F3|nr:CerR family C-terminal domain-containing protein [Acidovorax sp. NCPPB 4044]MDA8523484.1 CerR family C-terminal domain-containing protein [Acidovorax sp. NCPPB 4044]